MACLAHEINLSIISASLGWKIQYQKNKLFIMTNLKQVEKLTVKQVQPWDQDNNYLQVDSIIYMYSLCMDCTIMW